MDTRSPDAPETLPVGMNPISQEHAVIAQALNPCLSTRGCFGHQHGEP